MIGLSYTRDTREMMDREISSKKILGWDEYFMEIASIAATRSTCIVSQVGAVLVKDRQIVSTGYNGSPSGTKHCIEQGYCHEGVKDCHEDRSIPSRAVHAEANAIAQAAKHGIATNGCKIYSTLQPCLSCFKLIVNAGIIEVVYKEDSGRLLTDLEIEVIHENEAIVYRQLILD
jgi:dCMP deaminase